LGLNSRKILNTKVQYRKTEKLARKKSAVPVNTLEGVRRGEEDGQNTIYH